MHHNRTDKKPESPLGFHSSGVQFSCTPSAAPLGERGRPGVQPRLSSSAGGAASKPKVGAMPVKSRTAQIRDLNDAFRTSLPEGKCIMTAGVSKLGLPFVTAAVAATRAHDDFTPDNDPEGEHDFGAFMIGDERLCWKIDYYDPTLRFGSRDPSDPTETKRLLTIMLADEY